MDMDRDPISALFSSAMGPMDPRWAPEATHSRHIPAGIRSRQIQSRRASELDRRMEPGDFRALPESHHPVDPFSTDGTLGPTRKSGGVDDDPFRGGNWSLVEGLYAGRLDPRPRSPLRPGTEGGPPGYKPREVANRAAAKGVDPERGGGLVVSAAPAAWDETHWPKTRVPGPRFVSVSGAGWETSGNELRSALLGGAAGLDDEDQAGDDAERDVFEAAAAGRKAESRWRKAGIVAKMTGGMKGGGEDAAGGGGGLLAKLQQHYYHREAGGKLLNAGKTKIPAKALTMVPNGNATRADDAYDQEDDDEKEPTKEEERPSKEAADAAIALALALSGKGGAVGGGGGGAKKAKKSKAKGPTKVTSSGGRAAYAAYSSKKSELGGGGGGTGKPTAGSSSSRASPSSSARGAGGFLGDVAGKVLGAKIIAGGWKRKARMKAIAGGSRAVPRFGNGGADYLVNMTDRLYADKGEFQQFVTPLPSERSEVSSSSSASAAASTLMPPSEVIRGEAEWKHARPPAPVAMAPKTKALSVWQRLNATTKLVGARAGGGVGGGGNDSVRRVAPSKTGGSVKVVTAGSVVRAGGAARKKNQGSLWSKAGMAAKLSSGVSTGASGAAAKKSSAGSGLWGKAKAGSTAAAKLGALTAASASTADAKGKGNAGGTGGGGKATAERSLWKKVGAATRVGVGIGAGGRTGLGRGFDAIEDAQEEGLDDDDEVYGGVLDRSRFHPARYDSKGETREEMLRRKRGGGAMTAAEFTTEQARKKSAALADLVNLKLRLQQEESGSGQSGEGHQDNHGGVAGDGNENDENIVGSSSPSPGMIRTGTPPSQKTIAGGRWRQVTRNAGRGNKALAAARRQNVETVVSALIKMKLEKNNKHRIKGERM